jgi:hypothetical protein
MVDDTGALPVSDLSTGTFQNARHQRVVAKDREHASQAREQVVERLLDDVANGNTVIVTRLINLVVGHGSSVLEAVGRDGHDGS